MKHLLRTTVVAGLAAASFAATGSAAFAETPPNMLVVAGPIDDITSLDPAQGFEFAGTDVMRNVYGNLVNLEPGNIEAGYQPDLAESWEVSNEGRTICFTMREGLTHHSGNPITAADAEFSLERVVKLNKTPAFIITQFGFTPENVEEQITAEGNEVCLTTDKVYATSFILNVLTAAVSSIVDKETVLANEVDGDLGNQWLSTHSAGNYAYRLVEWRPNEQITLQANPDFYKGAPAMERVIIRHVAESATKRLLLERGDIDVARFLNPEDIAGLEGNPDIKIQTELRGRIMYLGLNQNIPELANPKVIEAFKHLIDYEGMANSFLKGQHVVHQTFLPETFLGAIDDQPYELDVEKAKALLAEAGVSDLTLEVGVRDAQERIEIAQSLQNTFAQAGITLNITVGTGAQILGRYRARDLPIALEQWGPDYPDPHTNASTFAFNPDNSLEANATGILAWRIAWDTGGLTPKVAAAVEEQDTEARRALYGEIQREFLETAPFIPMFQLSEQAAMRENVNGLSLGGPPTAAAYWEVTK